MSNEALIKTQEGLTHRHLKKYLGLPEVIKASDPLLELFGENAYESQSHYASDHDLDTDCSS